MNLTSCVLRNLHVGLFAVLLAQASFGCAAPEGSDEGVSVRSEPLVGQDEFLYLCCNATSWNADEGTRLESTADPYTFQITYKVTEPWMVSHGDSCQLTRTNERNGWGTQQVFYGVRSGFSPLAVPGSAPLAQGGSLQLRYPAPGFYTVQVNFRSGVISVAAATPALAAEENANRYYSYLANRFGWSGVDGAGLRVPIVIDAGPANNAQWNGSSVLIGAADGVHTDSFAFSRDMMAHELTHAVASHSSRLLPESEPGVLNEAFADALAAFSTANGTVVDWKMGETVWTPAIASDALRRIDEPHTGYNRETLAACQFDAARPFLCGQAAHLREYVNSGLNVEQLNNGILNRATYLVVHGGYNEGTRVQGIGVRKAEQIYFETLTERLTPRATLRDARHHLGQTCQSLVGQHGITPADCDSIAKVFASVGVEAPALNGPAGISGKVLKSGVPAQVQVVLAVTSTNSPAIGNMDLLTTTTDTSGVYRFSAAAIAAALAPPVPQVDVVYQVRYRNPQPADMTRVSAWDSQWFERVGYASGTVVPTFDIAGLPGGSMAGSPSALPVSFSWNHRTAAREYYRWQGAAPSGSEFGEFYARLHLAPYLTVTAANVAELGGLVPFSELATWHVRITNYTGAGRTNRYDVP